VHVVDAEWRDEMSWEGGELKHVKFVMLKENTDTQVNMDKGSKTLKIPWSRQRGGAEKTVPATMMKKPPAPLEPSKGTTTPPSSACACYNSADICYI
jgi:hypothetical protein